MKEHKPKHCPHRSPVLDRSALHVKLPHLHGVWENKSVSLQAKEAQARAKGWSLSPGQARGCSCCTWTRGQESRCHLSFVRVYPLQIFTEATVLPFQLSGSSLVFRVLPPACLHCTAQTLPSGFSRAADLLSCCPKASYAPHPYSRKNVYLTSFSIEVNSCLELPAPETSSQLQLRVWFQFVGVSTYLYAITQRDEKL